MGSLQRRYDFVKRKPQLTTTSRKKAAAGDSCVKMLYQLKDILVKYGYMTHDNQWTERGKKYVVALDETGGKNNTKYRKCLTTDKIPCRRAKTETPPHCTVVAAHNFLFETLRPLIITSHKCACSKACADAIYKVWPQALLSSTENGYISTTLFLIIYY